jgi:drug/metabolite transporter (DMT)-like permease
MFTCILGFFILGETKPWQDICALFAVFLAVVIILTGAQAEEATSMTVNIWVLVALFAQPILIAYKNIAMRQMRKMNPSSVTCYTNMAIVVFSIVMLLLSGQSFSFFKDLTLESWVLLFSVGLITCVH